jgi:hypothetical protein
MVGGGGDNDTCGGDGGLLLSLSFSNHDPNHDGLSVSIISM